MSECSGPGWCEHHSHRRLNPGDQVEHGWYDDRPGRQIVQIVRRREPESSPDTPGSAWRELWNQLVARGGVRRRP